jgi:hypothetical protein
LSSDKEENMAQNFGSYKSKERNDFLSMWHAIHAAAIKFLWQLVL